MEFKFNCSCGQLLVRGNPVHKDLTCNCSKTYTFFNGEYHEYELGIIVTNENIEKLDRLECNGVGTFRKLTRRKLNDKKRRIIKS
jgi:hypothetical protein